MKKIKPDEFKVITQYILEVSGLSIETGKEYLIESRLQPILQQEGCSSFSELYHKVKMDASRSIEKKIIDAITTKETYFFRDVYPFELLQHKILPDLIDRKTSNSNTGLPVQIRIWCSASSTGQEVYSIAMIIKELYLDHSKFQVTLLGTDISNEAIAIASRGRYNKFEIERGLTKDRRQKFFAQDGADGNFWKIKDEIRAMASFKTMNLLDPFTGLGKFDIILCRNVAIYFTLQERQKLYEKIAEVLEPKGYLVIGATESLTNDTALFVPRKYLRSVFYQLNQSAHK